MRAVAGCRKYESVNFLEIAGARLLLAGSWLCCGQLAGVKSAARPNWRALAAPMVCLVALSLLLHVAAATTVLLLLLPAAQASPAARRGSLEQHDAHLLRLLAHQDGRLQPAAAGERRRRQPRRSLRQQGERPPYVYSTARRPNGFAGVLCSALSLFLPPLQATPCPTLASACRRRPASRSGARRGARFKRRFEALFCAPFASSYIMPLLPHSPSAAAAPGKPAACGSTSTSSAAAPSWRQVCSGRGVLCWSCVMQMAG